MERRELASVYHKQECSTALLKIVKGHNVVLRVSYRSMCIEELDKTARMYFRHDDRVRSVFM